MEFALLRGIETMESSPEFNQLNFERVTYQDLEKEGLEDGPILDRPLVKAV